MTRRELDVGLVTEDCNAIANNDAVELDVDLVTEDCHAIARNDAGAEVSF